MVEKNLVEPKELASNLKELIPPIKTCLSDDWSPDLRFATCVFVEKLLMHTKDFVDYENVHELYPALLERLDDA
jgi:hypothetical protein